MAATACTTVVSIGGVVVTGIGEQEGTSTATAGDPPVTGAVRETGSEGWGGLLASYSSLTSLWKISICSFRNRS